MRRFSYVPRWRKSHESQAIDLSAPRRGASPLFDHFALIEGRIARCCFGLCCTNNKTLPRPDLWSGVPVMAPQLAMSLLKTAVGPTSPKGCRERLAKNNQAGLLANNNWSHQRRQCLQAARRREGARYVTFPVDGGALFGRGGGSSFFLARAKGERNPLLYLKLKMHQIRVRFPGFQLRRKEGLLGLFSSPSAAFPRAPGQLSKALLSSAPRLRAA